MGPRRINELKAAACVLRRKTDKNTIRLDFGADAVWMQCSNNKRAM